MDHHYEFHDGEVSVQVRTSERAVAVRNGAMIGDRIVGGAVPFVAQQRFVVIGGADGEGRLWPAVVFGRQGFVSTSDGMTVTIDRTRSLALDETALAILRAGADLGMLAIELGTRRRLRINGTIAEVSDSAVTVRVREAYPNCPKYIQRRHLSERGAALAPRGEERGHRLDACASLVDQADTFFVTTCHVERGADVSHRGGRPGFIQRLDDVTLRIPDYAGNSMYNTLGNLMLDDRAGLAVLDFAGGRVLHLTGHATVFFEQPENPVSPTGGTGRYWEFRVDEWRTSAWANECTWELLDYSPFCPVVGPKGG